MTIIAIIVIIIKIIHSKYILTQLNQIKKFHIMIGWIKIIVDMETT